MFGAGDELHVGGLITVKEEAREKKPHLREPENLG